MDAGIDSRRFSVRPRRTRSSPTLGPGRMELHSLLVPARDRSAVPSLRRHPRINCPRHRQAPFRIPPESDGDCGPPRNRRLVVLADHLRSASSLQGRRAGLPVFLAVPRPDQLGLPSPCPRRSERCCASATLNERKQLPKGSRSNRWVVVELPRDNPKPVVAPRSPRCSPAVKSPLSDRTGRRTQCSKPGSRLS